MRTKVQKWGNSLALRIPSAFAKELGMETDTAMEISQEKGYPFEIPLPAGDPVSGVVLADQVKSVDWLARGVKFAGMAPPMVMKEISGKLALLVG